MNLATPPKALALSLSADNANATINIRGDIGDWWEGRHLEQVEREIDWLPDTVKNLTLRITSRGGDLAQALAIHNALSRLPARKVAVIEGVAASAATIIAMAADEIQIHANAAMMVHGVWFQDDDGNPVEAPEAERALNETMVETYAAKTGKTREALLKALSTDTWMTGREAVAAGFADPLIELSPAQAQASAIVALASAAGVPESVIARAQAEAEQGDLTATPATEPKNPNASEGGDPPPAPVPASDAAITPTAASNDTFAAKINAIAVAHGLGDHVAAWLLDGSITTADQAEAAIREAREVRELCAFANAADLAPAFIRARKSLAEVRAELINARANAADAAHTDGHLKSSTSQPPRTGSKPAVSIASIYSTLNRTAQH